ncbi:hypothetical protein Tco_0722424, partial [Tanacetum coccineum]
NSFCVTGIRLDLELSDTVEFPDSINLEKLKSLGIEFGLASIGLGCGRAQESYFLNDSLFEDTLQLIYTTHRASDWGRLLLGFSGPSSQLKFSGRFEDHVHLGFHLLLIGLGANGIPPCGFLSLPLVDFLVLVMAHETEHSAMSPIRSKNCTSLAIGKRHLPIESTITSISTDVMKEALPEAPPATATAAIRNAYARRVIEQQEVACLMLVSMTPEIPKNVEDYVAFEILLELKTMFQQQAEQELFETVKVFHACKQEKGQSVSTYVLKMKAYLDQIDRLVYPIPFVLGVKLILTSLSKDYDQFV